METDFEQKLQEIGEALETLKDENPEEYALLESQIQEHFDALFDLLSNATGE